MITILHYEIHNAINDIDLPIGYEVLHVGTTTDKEGYEKISIWCKVDVDPNYQPGMTEHVRFLVFGTGANMDELLNFPYQYIGSVKMSNKHTYHVFEVLNKSVV